MSRLWARMSRRERLLAVASGAVIVAAGLWLMVGKAAGYVGRLDSAIDGRQQELVNLRTQLRYGEGIDAAFAEMAAQHSIAWTEQEIQERLRDEITRLALKNPPPADSPGSTVIDNSAPRLVYIPRLPAGTLKTAPQYREYQIGFDVSPTTIAGIMMFLTRLKNSPQALRIDYLELKREPQSDRVEGSIEVTRTIVDTSQSPEQPAAAGAASEGQQEGVSSGNLARNGSFELWDSTGASPSDWEAEGCVLAKNDEYATEGVTCLSAAGEREGGLVFQWHELVAGVAHELTADIRVEGLVDLGIMDDARGEMFTGAQELATAGTPQRYTIRFTVSGDAGTKTAVRAPCLVLKQAGAAVYLDRVVLMQVVE